MEGVSPKTFKIFLIGGATLVGAFLVGVYLATTPSPNQEITKPQGTVDLEMKSEATGTSEDLVSIKGNVQEKNTAGTGGNNTAKPSLVKNSQYENAQKYIEIYESDKLSEELALGGFKADEFEQGLQLDQSGKIDFARNLIADDNGLIIYHGANLLLKSKKNDEAIPALAGLITSGKSETDLNGRMGYDWAHGMDARTMMGILSEINHYLLSRIDEYGPTEKSRAMSYLCGVSGVSCDAGSFDKGLIEKTLTEQEKITNGALEEQEKLQKHLQCGGECRLDTINSVLINEGYTVVQKISSSDLNALVGHWRTKETGDVFTIARVGSGYYFSFWNSKTTDEQVLLAEINKEFSPWSKLEILGDKIKIQSTSQGEYLVLTNNGPMYLMANPLNHPSTNYRYFLEKT